MPFTVLHIFVSPSRQQYNTGSNKIIKQKQKIIIKMMIGLITVA